MLETAGSAELEVPWRKGGLQDRIVLPRTEAKEKEFMLPLLVMWAADLARFQTEGPGGFL